MTISKLAVASAFVVACGGPGSTPPDGGADADKPRVRTFSGILHHRFVTASGVKDVPANLAGAPLSALVPPSFASFPGTANADGTFSIPNLPVGTFYLVLGNRILVMSADTVDLSFDVLGRFDSRFATASTPLSFDVTGLSAWQSTDEIQMLSPSSGTSAYQMEQTATAGMLALGDTRLTGFTFDLSKANDPALIDGGAADQLTLTQLATQTDGTRTYRTVAKSFTPSGFTIANGGMASLTGAFSTPPQATLDVTWDRPAFAAELVAHSPGSDSHNWSTLAISTVPQASTRGLYTDGADLAIFAPGYLNDSTTVTAPWSYGDPYPSTWGKVAWVRYFRYRFIQLPSATPVAIFSRLLAYRDLSTVSAQAPIEPIMGTVVSPKINSADALGTALLTGIGTMPTLSWTAPTTGTAARYYVTIDLVMLQNGATALKPLATLETADTQLVIPPSLLIAGQTYVFEIESRSVGTVDLAATPNQRALPEGAATVTTTMATP